MGTLLPGVQSKTVYLPGAVATQGPNIAGPLQPGKGISPSSATKGAP